MLPERLHADALPQASETPDLGFAVGLEETALLRLLTRPRQRPRVIQIGWSAPKQIKGEEPNFRSHGLPLT